MKRLARRLLLSLGRLTILLITIPGVLIGAIALILWALIGLAARVVIGLGLLCQIIFILVCAAIDPDGEEHV